ncbi:MAG: hypothetical protein IT379_40210 [Deltaproteobacteria bacterium]|nr:hypothetical protein [Deltaproteobacteria bacterium]
MSSPVVGEPLGSAIESLEVVDADGHVRSLSTVFARSDALVLCVRQLGCVACSEQVALLRARLDELVRLDVAPWILACAPVVDLAPWITRQGLDDSGIRVCTDPTLAVHRALGLHRGFWRAWGLRAAIGFASAFSHGFLPGRFRGDVSQQAGALLVTRDGMVRALVRSEHLGDHVPLVALIEATLRARVSEADFHV